MPDTVSIPVEFDADRAIAAIEKMATSLNGMQGGLQRTAQSSARAVDGVNSLTASFNEASRAFSNIQGILGNVERVATRVAELSSTAEHLSRTAATTGINMVDLSNHLGRFTNEVDLSSAAMRLHEAGISANREQFTQLARAAGSLAEELDTGTNESLQQLNEWLLTGSERIGRHLSPALHEVSGATHTAQERFDALVAVQSHMAEATDNATTSLDRQRNMIERFERDTAQAFEQSASKANGLNDTLRGMEGGLTSGAASAQTLGGTLATAANLAAHAWSAALLPITAYNRALEWALSHATGASDADASRAAISGTTVTQMSDAVRARNQGITGWENAGGDQAAFRTDRSQLINWHLHPHAATGGANNAAQEWLRTFEEYIKDHPADIADTFGGHLTESAVHGIERHFPHGAQAIVDRMNREIGERFRRGLDEMMERSTRTLELPTAREGEDDFNPQARSTAELARLKDSMGDQAINERNTQAQRDAAATTRDHTATVNTLSSAWSNAAKSMGSFFSDLAAKKTTWADFGKALLASTTSALAGVAKSFGELEMAKGAASFADGDFPQGIAQEAAGAGLFLAGSVIAGLGGGGGGSSGGASSGTATSGGSGGSVAAPVSTGGASQSSGTAPSYVLNFNAPIIGAGGMAEVGHYVIHAQNEANRQLGTQLNPGVVRGP